MSVKKQDTWEIVHIPEKQPVSPNQQPTANVLASLLEPKIANTLVRRLNKIAPLEDLRHVKRVQKKTLEGGVFPYCPEPPHKALLDQLLETPGIDRSVASLLGYEQLNSRLRQTGGKGSVSKSKAKVSTVVSSTEELSEESDSESVSEYTPSCEMANFGDEAVEALIQKSKTERRAQMDAKRAKMRKMGASGKGKGVAEASDTVSPCVYSDETAAVLPPHPSAGRTRVYKTPSYFDVDRCARWTPPPHIGESDRAELEKLPRLPKPRKSHGFGVIGCGSEYAYDVIGPYMSFDGDKSKLEKEGSAEGFGAMLKDSAALMARLSFHSRAVKEREVNMKKQLVESEAEVRRMRVELDGYAFQRSRLVDDAVIAYNKGVREGELEGWSEAVKAYMEAGHLNQAAVDSVVCHLGSSEGEEELMEEGAAEGVKEGVARGDDMMM